MGEAVLVDIVVFEVVQSFLESLRVGVVMFAGDGVESLGFVVVMSGRGWLVGGERFEFGEGYFEIVHGGYCFVMLILLITNGKCK